MACQFVAPNRTDTPQQITKNLSQVIMSATPTAMPNLVQMHPWKGLLSKWVKYNTHTHIHLTALFPGIPRWAGTRKVKPIWILLKQETVSGSGISLAICKSAPGSRQPRQHPTTQFFTGRMPFLPPNQQCQSTEGTFASRLQCKIST